MKKIILFLLAGMLITFTGYALNILPENVPLVVKQAFEKKFPAATNVAYQMEKKDYEVTFKDKGVGMSANFNPSGEWLETETVMIESDVPKEVLTSVATNYPGFIITEVAKIDGPNDVLNYEMKLKKDKVVEEVKFSPKGEILKKTPLKK
jgi:hypothetical protein